jgi:hypothetical protein
MTAASSPSVIIRILIVALISGIPLAVDAQRVPPQQFPAGRLRTLDELPASRFRGDLQRLAPAARKRAHAWLHSSHFTSEDLPSLHTDRDGGVCYACQFAQVAEIPADANENNPKSHAAAALPVSPFPKSLVFHSRPGAPNVLYINFVGEVIAGTGWNTVLSRLAIPALGFSADSDYLTFNESEQIAIKQIWQRVAEDFAPFDINITTERPTTWNNRTAMVLVTRRTDALGFQNPHNSGGGVAYMNVFATSTFSKYRHAWVYHDNLGNQSAHIGEAVSHEFGHILGLSHDGNSENEYYGGHGSGETSWGPLMGTGYNRHVSQWSKGEYFDANNTQDDLETLARMLTYRADDHGNAHETATELVISGGTEIFSTTPEDDPEHQITGNKGIIERSEDVDVFTFVTGSGPVNLQVDPWITAGGTRGGNLDVLAELYSEDGTLVAWSDPADKTSASIECRLPEGRYFLHVRGSGAGNPLASEPLGYTAYGSLGQYFIRGTVSVILGYVAPPVASLTTQKFDLAGQTRLEFQVTYADNVAISADSIDSSDLHLSGPNGFSAMAELMSAPSSDGSSVVATYSIRPPHGKTWMPVHNGLYTVSMRPAQVADVEGEYVASGEIGKLKVEVPIVVYSATMETNPGWKLMSGWDYGVPAYSGGKGPVAGFSGTQIIAFNRSGNYPNSLTTRYATTPPIDCSGTTSLTLRFRRWLGLRKGDTASIQVSTNQTKWVTVWSSSKEVTDHSWESVRYDLPTSIAGCPTVWLRWGLASNLLENDLGWNIDDVELSGQVVPDTVPPLATLSKARTITDPLLDQTLTVTYTDTSGVRPSSLDSSDILVTGPNGYSKLLVLVDSDSDDVASPLRATYLIPSPDDRWSSSANGVYKVTLLPNAVEDSHGNRAAEAVLGSFTVAIEHNMQGVLQVSAPGEVGVSGVVGGPFMPGSITYHLANTGTSALEWSASKTADWLGFGVNHGTLKPGETVQIPLSIAPLAQTLAPGTYKDAVIFTDISTGEERFTNTIRLTVEQPVPLVVGPSMVFSTSGIQGGSLTNESFTLTLLNSSETNLQWSAKASADWVDLDIDRGALAPGAIRKITLKINENALSLATGKFASLVNFSVVGSGSVTRKLELEVLAPPQIVSCQTTPSGSFQISIEGTAGTTVQVEASADLDEWEPFTTAIIGQDGTATIDDAERSSRSQRFYRLVTAN